MEITEEMHNSAPAAPVVAPTKGSMFFKREMNGATFLSLEHAAHMALVVIVAILVALGMATALSMWSGGAATSTSAMGAVLEAGGKQLEAVAAIGLVSALLVLVPMLVVLDRRTRAEWQKRSGYSGRLAYKVPVYTALGVLVAAKTLSVIMMVSVVVTSLVMIGTAGVDFGTLYLQQFVPALVSTIVFGVAALYVFQLAKGRDQGRVFSGLVALVGAALVLALLITSVATLHSTAATPVSNPTDDYFKSLNSGGGSTQDLFNY